MFLEIHFQHSHLDFFPPNLGAVNDKQGERFHQNIATTKKRYRGKSTVNMLADYYWMIIHSTYKRKASRSVKGQRICIPNRI